MKGNTFGSWIVILLGNNLGSRTDEACWSEWFVVVALVSKVSELDVFVVILFWFIGRITWSRDDYLNVDASIVEKEAQYWFDGIGNAG